MYGKSFVMETFRKNSFYFILFQNEVGRRAQHPFERRNTLRHEPRDLSERRSLYEYRQIITAAHEIYALDFGIFRDPSGNSVEAFALFRGDFDLYERLYPPFVLFVRVDDRHIFDDIAPLFQRTYERRDFFRLLLQHGSDCFGRQPRIGRKNGENGFFKFRHKSFLLNI